MYLKKIRIVVGGRKIRKIVRNGDANLARESYTNRYRLLFEQLGGFLLKKRRALVHERILGGINGWQDVGYGFESILFESMGINGRRQEILITL